MEPLSQPTQKELAKRTVSGYQTSLKRFFFYLLKRRKSDKDPPWIVGPPNHTL